MLAEFLLTPDAISEVGGRDGSDVVRELTSCLFPFSATPIALVCKLGGEDWEVAASRKIARIPNSKHRHDAMSLFQRLLSELCVTRPAIPRVSDEESEWIDAGKKSSNQVPLGKIVVSEKSPPPVPHAVTLKDFVSPTFWEPLSNPRLVGRETASQEDVLRAICTHSDWLLMRLPQIRGGSDDEIVTVKQILKLSNQLPVGFKKTTIDLHLCRQPKIPEHRLIDGVASELASFVQRGVEIRLTIWPEKYFINRELLGGDFAKTSPGDIVRRTLWWITMTHVAVGSRNAATAGEAGNTWSLFPRHKAHERYTQIDADKSGTSVILR